MAPDVRAHMMEHNSGRRACGTWKKHGHINPWNPARRNHDRLVTSVVKISPCFIKKYIYCYTLRTVHRDKHTWARPIRCKLFLRNSFQLNYLRHETHESHLWISSLHRAFRKITLTINQQMHLYNFHLKHFKTLKTTPTSFDLFRSSSGSFVVPC